MKSLFYSFHRKVGPWLAVPLILWALSGILHPMMANWFRPEIAKTFLIPKPVVIPANAQAPADVFSDLEELHQLKVISLAGRPVYLAVTPDQSLHFRDALTAERLESGAEDYSVQLARAYSEDGDSEVKRVTRLDSFSSTYAVINRLLPAYRVALERADGLEIIVDPRTGRLASFDTPGKRWMSRLFSWFHTWSFLGAADGKLRITVVLLVSIMAFLTALSGVISLITLRGRRSDGTRRKMGKARRFHRLLGGFSAVFFFMFAASGIFHVVVKYNYDDSPQWVSGQTIPVEDLQSSPAGVKAPAREVSLAVVGGTAYYRVGILDRENPTRAIYISPKDGSELEDGETLFARSLALEFSGYDESAISGEEAIGTFRPDYGFIFKRLPVWRVKFADQSYWHYTVDTADAHMSMRTGPLGLAEALSFINLHKFHLLDFAGRDTRDTISAVAALLVAAVTLLGVLVYFVKNRARKSSLPG